MQNSKIEASMVGPSTKSVTLFLANFNHPPSVTLFHTSRDPSESRPTSHILDPPIISWLITKNPDKSPLVQILSIVRGSFCPGGFC